MTDAKKPVVFEDSTLAALLKTKPGRGRPHSLVRRQSVYVSLAPVHKSQLKELADALPLGIKRSDVPDIAVAHLAFQFEQLRNAVADRDRELPEGIADIDDLYFLWDLQPLEELPVGQKWTSIRLSDSRVVEFGQLQGVFKVLFGSTRSEVFYLALALLGDFTSRHMHLSHERLTPTQFIEHFLRQ